MINFELPQAGVYEYVPRKRIRWGQAALDAVREEIDDTARLFILTTASLVNKTNIINEIQTGLSTQCSGLFYGISEHTPFGDVVAAAQAARDANANIILSVGGGSIIDAAKAVIICLRENIDTVEELSCRIGQISEGPGGPRHISIPTTLSGAEHTEFAGGIDPATGTKELLGGIFARILSYLTRPFPSSRRKTCGCPPRYARLTTQLKAFARPTAARLFRRRLSVH